ncbi:MAG: S8 family serine peptidase [Bacteroidetes bacterium]|nr:S8 family serine peptidase [Bacteroidota bacterium]
MSFQGQLQNHRAWVIDTGIDLNHSDLNVNSSLSDSFVQYTSSPDDDHGHGTHVAGIIAARVNNSDVVGVAPGLQVIALKMCDDDGYCFVSDAMAGVNYASNNYNSGDVANMSIGWPTYLASDPNYPYIDIALSVLENAIEDAADDGLMFTILAHNYDEDADLWSPSRMNHNNVWTMSAINSSNQFASFSNYGNPPIDFAAPGVSVLSLWRNGGTYTADGTSQATPHVAGILLGCGPSGLGSNGTASGDPASPADPIARATIAGFPSNVTHSVVQSPIDPSKESPKLDWNAVSGTTSYEIQRKHWQHDWKLWASPTSTSYTDIMTQSQNLQATTWQPSSYWVAYRVRAVNECGAGPWAQAKYFKYDSGDSIPTNLEEGEELLADI